MDMNLLAWIKQVVVLVDKAGGGTRAVGFYSIDEKRCLCFKQWPEAPAYEIAIHKLYRALFPEDEGNFPLPASQVIVMNNQVFSVSEFMEGETLEHILKAVGTNPNYGNQWNFNLEKFQKLVIFSLLTNPEDCRPQNCLIKKIRESEEYQFILIDNERNLGQESAEFNDPEKGRIATRVHCALFCFDQLIMSKIDRNFLARQRFTSITAIHRWIKECQSENQYQARLQQHFESEKIVLGNTIFGVYHDERFIWGLFEKLHTMMAACAEEERSLAEIFWLTSPYLAEVYQISKDTQDISQGTHLLPNALHRILSIDGGRAGSVAPPSAYIPLGVYLGSTEALSKEETFALLRRIREVYGMELDPRVAAEFGEIQVSEEVEREFGPILSSGFLNQLSPEYLALRAIDIRKIEDNGPRTYVIRASQPFYERINSAENVSVEAQLGVCLDWLNTIAEKRHVSDIPVGQEGVYDNFIIGTAIQDKDSFFHAIFTEAGSFTGKVIEIAKGIREKMPQLVREEKYKPFMIAEMVTHYQKAFNGGNYEDIPATLLSHYQNKQSPVHEGHVKKYTAKRYSESGQYAAIQINDRIDYGFAAIVARENNLRINCYVFDQQGDCLNYFGTIGDTGTEIVNVLWDKNFFHPLFNQTERPEKAKNVAQAYLNWVLE